jgi:1-acyl-sn-glycerol-3-phosphate acyltransferase
MPQDQPEPIPREPGVRRRDVLRWLFLPYTWFVYIPCLIVSTLGWGIIAMVIALFSPRLAFHCGTIWSYCLCRLAFTRVTVEGRANAHPHASYVIMSNHQSQFDVLAFYGHWGRQFRWVMKKELRQVPGLGWYCAAGGHIFLDRSSRAAAINSLRAAKPLLGGGISVMIFPEGTRSRDGRLGAFKKGGFMMAIDLDLPILPISISGSRQVLPSQSMRLLPGTIRIRVHEPVDPKDFSIDERDRLIAEVHERIASGLTPWERGSSERSG